MRGVRHLLALGTAAVCGVLLYCLRLRFPNPLTEALGPANASPWETGKLVFWSMLPAAAVLRRLEGSGGPCRSGTAGGGHGAGRPRAGAGTAGRRRPAVVRRSDPAGGGRPRDGCLRSRPVCPPPLSPFDGNAGKKGPPCGCMGDLFVGMLHQRTVARRPSVL